MIPDRIGIIGSTHGVKVSSNPAAKKKPHTAHRLPPARMLAAVDSSLIMSSCPRTGRPVNCPTFAFEVVAGVVAEDENEEEGRTEEKAEEASPLIVDEGPARTISARWVMGG